VSKAKKKYENVVVVVSAMAGVTSKFVTYADGLNAHEGNPEYDSLVSSGELVTAGLMALALNNIGLKARSYASWQIPILTDSNFGRATIENVETSNIRKDLDDGTIPVVCGFQGMTADHRITTLGRGGSDSTAVALTASLGADICEIYSDVDGVYTVDPNLCPESQLLSHISYLEMLEMSARGAKIMQTQSVEYAMDKKVKIRVASSFSGGDGSIISAQASGRKFCGLAVIPRLAQIKMFYKTDDGAALSVDLLRKNFIYCDVCNDQDSRKASLLTDKKNVPAALDLLSQQPFIRSVKQEVTQRHSSKISIISMNNSEKAAIELVTEFSRRRMEVFCHFYSANRTSLIVPGHKLMSMITVLHRYCGLDK
jgi:aspartate kinase